MTVLMVPDDGKDLWPSLGPQVCDWIEENLVFGPGDLLGEPAVLDDEKRALIYRMYEIYPEGHPKAGRRRFRRCALSLAKGLAKTEMVAWIAAAELAPDAPVRCIGWENGEPIGGPVRDPYIPLVAYTEEQSDELAYGALKAILERSPIADQFDIGLERIMRKGGDGKAVSLSGSPNARDGARTTFQVADETHWWTLPKLKAAHQTMLANLPKRRLADAWAIEVTTAFEPGAGSVAEDTMTYARALHEGRAHDENFFFFHRQASDEHDLETEEGARAAVIEASGPAASWRDIDAIVGLWRDTTIDRKYWERVWCNRPVQSSKRAFDVESFRKLEKKTEVPKGSIITVGFDGAQTRDSTAIVATHVATGFQWLVGLWEAPPAHDPRAANWRVPEDEVDAALASLFEEYNVWRLYADPPFWQGWVSTWIGRYGDDRVIEWWTNRRKQMAYALQRYVEAIERGEIGHDGNSDLVRHVGNAYRQDLSFRDENDQPLWLIRKDRPDSPFKIDAAMAAVLSWEARADAIASGVLEHRAEFQREWVKYWTTPPKGGNRYVIVNPSHERKKSEHTEVVVLELREDESYYVVDLVRDRLSASERADLLFELHREHRPLRVGYEEHGLEADMPHIRERQDRENYRFSVQPLEGGKLTVDDRIRRLVPLFQAGRVVLPETLTRKVGDAECDMVREFLTGEYESFPASSHKGLLDALSRILDIHAEFPAAVRLTAPAFHPSDW